MTENAAWPPTQPTFPLVGRPRGSPSADEETPTAPSSLERPHGGAKGDFPHTEARASAKRSRRERKRPAEQKQRTDVRRSYQRRGLFSDERSLEGAEAMVDAGSTGDSVCESEPPASFCLFAHGQGPEMWPRGPDLPVVGPIDDTGKRRNFSKRQWGGPARPTPLMCVRQPSPALPVPATQFGHAVYSSFPGFLGYGVSIPGRGVK